MLGGKKKRGSVAKIETLIGHNTKVEGNVSFSGGLHVDGVIKGNVVCDPESAAVLTLSENGHIEGDVRVPNVILNGRVNGDVYAYERIELASRAKVAGNVYYKLIEMAIGAEVNGNLFRSDDPAEAVPEVEESSKHAAVSSYSSESSQSGDSDYGSQVDDDLDSEAV